MQVSTLLPVRPSQQDDSHAIARSASLLTLLTFLSPITGMAVEAVLAWRFGASALVDAYRIGSIVGLFGWQLFLAQILPYVVVPLIVEYKAGGKGAEAWRLAFPLANCLLIPVSIVALWMFAWPGCSERLLGPGLRGSTASTAAYFVRWFALTFIPFVWCGVAAGVLYAEGIFWLPTICSSAGNLTIGVLLLLFPGSARILVVGTLLAAAETLILHIIRLWPLFRQLGVSYLFTFNPLDVGVRRALSLAIPLLGTVALQQWWAVLLNRLLSESPAGSLATFGYAWTMGQIVVTAPSALALVLFPRFAESCRNSRRHERVDDGIKAIRMGLFVTIPLAAICFAFRKPLLDMAFMRGAFSSATGSQAARLFGFIVVACPAAAILDYTQKILYSSQRMWLPTYALFATVAMATVLAPAMSASFGVDGVAITAASFPCVQALILLLALGWMEPDFSLAALVLYAGGVAAIALPWVALGTFLSASVQNRLGSSQAGISVAALTGAGAALAGYAVSTVSFSLPEAQQAREFAKWNLGALAKALPKALR